MRSTRARVRESSATGFHFSSFDHAVNWGPATAGAAARTAARMRESRPATSAATVPPNENPTTARRSGISGCALSTRIAPAEPGAGRLEHHARDAFAAEVLGNDEADDRPDPRRVVGRRFVDATRHGVSESCLGVAPADHPAVVVGEEPLLRALPDEVRNEGSVAVAVMGAGVAFGVGGGVPETGGASRPPRKNRKRTIVGKGQVVIGQDGGELANLDAHSP